MKDYIAADKKRKYTESSILKYNSHLETPKK